MTFKPLYRLVIERDFYPDGQPFYAVKCYSCGDHYDYDSEDEAINWSDNHVCWGDEGDE